MARTRDSTSKTVRLPYSLGEHAVGNENDKLIQHVTTAVGSDLQVKIQTALGLGPWASCDRLTYAGAEIPSSFYEFWGSGVAAGASTLFPADVAHLRAALINTNLPVGMATDNTPDKLVGRFKTRLVADYNASGIQTDFGFSTNFARGTLDGIKLMRPRLLPRIEYSSYLEWRAWCDEQISATKDGVTTQINRFHCNLFFLPPFSFATFLSRMLQLSCTDLQIRKGMIRFLPGIDRPTVFDLDTFQLDYENFSFSTLDNTSLNNGVRVSFRDYDDPLLQEADPEVIDRRSNVNEAENFIEINAGVCNRSQARRVGSFWARVKIDFRDFVKVQSGWTGYPVLPGDLVTISHPYPNWTARQCKVIKKEENESDGDGYPIYAQIWTQNPYSDTDTAPLTTRTAAPVDLFDAPPLPTVAVTQDSGIRSDGSTFSQVVGTINFGTFGYGQTAQVFWMKPGEGYKHLIDVRPDASNNALFYAQNPPAGINFFKVVPISDLDVPNYNLSTANQKSLTVNPTDFIVDGQHISLGAFKANTGFAPDGSYTGRDVAVVPQAAVTAWVDSVSALGDDLICVLGVKFLTLAAGAYNQTDSVNGLTINIYDQYGAKKKTVTASCTLRGGQAYAQFKRIAADVYEGQCYFEILVSNSRGTSLPVYLHYNRASDNPTPVYTISNTPPAKKNAVDTPRELKVEAINYNTLNIYYINYLSVNIYYRQVGTLAWTLHTTNWNRATALNPFPSGAELEIQLRDNSRDSDRSEIVRVTTPAQPVLPPSRLAPTNLVVQRDPANSTTGLIPSWQRNATDNTGVELYCVENNTTYALAATDPSKTFGSLAEGQRLTFKVRNVFSGPAYSDWTATESEATAVTASAQPPSMIGGYYDESQSKNILQFAANPGTGNFKAQFREGSGDSWHDLGTTILPTDTTFSHTVLQSSVKRYFDYRISRSNDTGGYSSPLGVEIPIRDPYTPPNYGCFVAGTRVMSASWWRLVLFNVMSSLFERLYFDFIFEKRIEKIKIGDQVFAPAADGTLRPKTVVNTFIHEVDEYLQVEFSGKSHPTGTTGEHPYKTLGGSFIAMGKLPVGAEILARRHGLQITRKILSKRIIPGKTKVYNFTVEDLHTYVAERDDVHNKAPLNPDV